VPAEQVEEVIRGCVLTAGQGQAPARQAALKAGLPLSAGATTINKMCDSGMKAAMLAHDLMLAGSANLAVAGGDTNSWDGPLAISITLLGAVGGRGPRP
jgi:acetyl-CoA C-acetyltransferase